MFSTYKIGVMDATFFDLPKSSRLFKDLEQIEKIYVSTTINQEYWQFSQMLEGEKLAEYDNNFAKLKRLKPKKAIVNGQCAGDNKNQFDDTYKLALYFSSLPTKSILITANKLLIQKVVIKKLSIDIFDISSGRIIPHSEFGTEKNKEEYNIARQDNKAVPTSNIECDCDSVVYTSNGEKITLTASTGKVGFEAEIFKTDKEGFCAKIFHDGELTSAKLNNIKNLVKAFKNVDLPWFCVPKEVLYIDARRTIPVGCLEKYIESYGQAINTEIYDSDELIWENCDEFRKTKLIDTLELCLKLVRQVALLNCYGVYITDLNEKNFAASDSVGNHLVMWDADSFAFGSYYNANIGEEYIVSKYNLTQKTDIMECAGESLYNAVFGLISVAWGQPFDQASQFLQLVPKNLYDFIYNAMKNNYSFSVQKLLEELADSCAALVNSNVSECTYAEILDDCARRKLDARETFMSLENKNRTLNCECLTYKKPNIFVKIYNKLFK